MTHWGWKLTPLVMPIQIVRAHYSLLGHISYVLVDFLAGYWNFWVGTAHAGAGV